MIRANGFTIALAFMALVIVGVYGWVTGAWRRRDGPDANPAASGLLRCGNSLRSGVEPLSRSRAASLRVCFPRRHLLPIYS